VSIRVSLDSRLNFGGIHKITSNVRREVKKILPNARVTTQTDPLGHVQEGTRMLVKEIADRLPGSKGVHNVHVQKIDGKLCVDLHLEVSGKMTLKQAHKISDQIETNLTATNPNISEITIHMESTSDGVSRELNQRDTELESYIEHAAKRYKEIKSVGGVKIRRVAAGRHIVLRCYFDPNVSMREVYEITINLEKAIKSDYPDIERIDIHEEPAPSAAERLVHS